MPSLDFPPTDDYTFHVDQFRGNIPIIPVPDREAWKQLHGKTPMRVDAAPRLVNRALACIERDLSTLSSDTAINQQVLLEAVCDAVWADIDPHPGEQDVVIFDPETKAFWLYPA